MKFTRHGFRELLIGTLALALLAAAAGYFEFWWLILLLVPVLIWLWAFFRDPERPVPAHPADRLTMVSPADGKVSDVMELETDPVLGEPTVRIGIFLSVFNVHINRSPCDGVVTGVTYKKGRFINAMDHSKASEENESNTVVIAEPGAADRPVAVVRQIVGLIARRIICTKNVGDRVTRGERFGMIKFGSRTELSIPRRLNPKVLVAPGQKVRAGTDAVAEVDVYAGARPEPSPATMTDPEAEPLVQPTPA